MDQTFLIALGSNGNESLSDCADFVTQGIAELSKSGDLQAVSALYRTPCFPVGAGPDFVNAAVRLVSDRAPAMVLQHLHRIEADAGRERTQRWGPRVLDLDLLAAGDAVLPDRAGYAVWRDLPLARQLQEAPSELILPHPRLHERAFVLVPLMDVAPDWQHPVLGLSVREMCAALPAAARAAIQRI